MKSKDLREKLLKNANFRKEYFKQNISLEISHMIVRERVRRNLTQAMLARMVGTKQSGIARVERGNTLPRIEFLQRIAEALDLDLIVMLKGRDKTISRYPNSSNSGLMEIIQKESPYFKRANNFVSSSGAIETTNTVKMVEEIK